MIRFSNRLSEVSQHYKDGDTSLGFRRLIDVILDCRETSILKDGIDFTEWRYQSNPSQEEESRRADDLLQKVENAGYQTRELSTQPIIEAKQISKKYAKGSFELKPLQVVINPSEVVGLVGENGNGKTTLLRLLCGELKPDTGTIYYNFQRDYTDYYDLKTRLIYIPQRTEVLRGGLMDNLQFTCASYGIKGEENFYLSQIMLARLGLWPYKNLNWARLSSGYKMRFELARNLLRNPEVLLLDEPLANLDVLAQQIILEDLKYLSNSISHPFGVVLSSQQLYEVEKISDKILFLDNGKLVNDSSVNQEENKLLILELETSVDRSTLQNCLADFGLNKVQYNGGNYVLYFSSEASIHEILEALAKAKIPLTYFRDISSSSRRFFVDSSF